MSDIVLIEARRIELNVSQVELCREARIDPSTYTKLRQGVNIAPRPRTIRKLTAALDRFQHGTAA